MDKITSLVKKQYSSFPYPNIPVGSLEDEVLYSTNFEFVHYLCTGLYRKQEGIKILDAGCGTGYSTLKLAQQNPGAEIVAIDISRESLKIAEERLVRAGVFSEKITFLERNLLKLDDLSAKFDYIVSTGVLHHLSEPEKGLINLAKLLKEDGLMYLMLYSESGRYALNQTRKVINLLRENKTDFGEGLKIGREFINYLPEEHPIKKDYNKSYESALKSISKDFADSDSQFVDAYINAQERTYNIEELYDFLASSNLNLLRFYDELMRKPEQMFSNNFILLEKARNLSQKEIYQLSELIYGDQNFAFFCSKKKITKKEWGNEEILKAKILWCCLNKVTKLTDGSINISNPSGTGLLIQKEAKMVYNLLSENKSVKQIVTEFSNKYYLSENESEKIIIHFLKNFEQAGLLYFID